MKPSQATGSGASDRSRRLAAFLNLGAAEAARGALDSARTAYRQAEAVAPNDIRASYSLAILDLRHSRFADARRRLKSVVRRDPSMPNAWHNLGVAEQALGNWGGGVVAYEAALAADPAFDTARKALAIALAALGRAREAEHHYRQLAQSPAYRADALSRLAILSPASITDPELADLTAFATNASLVDRDRVAPLFAVAAVLEARNRFDEAFDALTRANGLKRALLVAGAPEHHPDHVARDHQISIDRVKALFTPEFLAEHRSQGDKKTEPIFIVGMPRSGSSLVEQILASHPRVQGMGESDSLWRAADGRFPYPPTATITRHHFRDLAGSYLALQKDRGWKPGNRLVDKTLDNHLHVGLIHLMFPSAVVLHVVRDPVDTGLACFRQLFATGNETLYEFADIAAEWRRYRAMMDHWRQVTPGVVVEVSYESLTEHPESEIRRLVTATCGLPWSEDCLRFHETPRAVATASASQVRRPISRQSVDRWRRYESRLAPLIEALGLSNPDRSPD